jgi:hypothetical protein
MNPKKCAFGVSAGQFLGFLVHERGIEISLKSQEVVRTMVPHTTKREFQQLIGKINFIRRFISNLSGRIKSFMDLVKIKVDEEFCWGQSNNDRSKKSKIFGKTTRVSSSPAGHVVLHLFVTMRYLHRLGSGISI